MATSLGELVVKLQADTAGFVTGLKTADAKLGGLKASLASVAKKSAVAFAGMGTAIGFAVRAASAQREAELKLASAIRGTGQAIDIEKIKKYASELQKVTTFGDEATISAAAMLTTFQLNEDSIISLMPRVQNLAAMYGMDLNSAAIQVGKALTSGIGVLSRYGITLTDAQKEAYKVGNQLARVSVLMEALDANTGNAAQAIAGTGVGALKQMRNALGDLVEQFGFLVEGTLATKIQSITAAVSGLTERVTQLSPATKEMLGKTILFGSILTGVVAGVGGLAVALSSVLPVLSALAAGFVAALPGVLAVAAGVAGLILVIGAVKQVYGQNTKEINSMFRNLAKDIQRTWRDLIAWISDSTMSIAETALTIKAFISGESPDAAYQMVKQLRTEGVGGMLLGTESGGGMASGFDADFKAVKQTWAAGVGVLKGLFSGILPTVSAAPTAASAPILGLPPAPVMGGTEATATARPLGADGEGSESVMQEAEALVTTVNPIRESLTTIGNSMADAALSFGETMMSKAGALGEVMNSAVQGFQQGGPFGAIFSVIADLAMRTKGFKDTVAHANKALEAIVKAFEPLTEAMQPLAVLTNDLLVIIGEALGPIFKALTPVIYALFQILRVVALIILYIVKGLGTAWNGLISGIQWVLRGLKLGKLADGMEKAKFNLNGVNRSIQQINSVSISSAKAAAKAAGEQEEAGEAAGEVADELDKLTSALTNVPEGFKVEAARYIAAQGESTGQQYSAEEFGAAGSNVQINITANDSRDVAEKVRDELEQRNLIESGTTFTMGSQFGVATGGA